MRITKEADYALRIMRYLASHGMCDSKKLSEKLMIPSRFTLKILRKLMDGTLIRSHVGVKGGYSLTCEPKDISIRRIIETVNGPLQIMHCLDNSYECDRMSNMRTDKNDCCFHNIFSGLNEKIANELDGITLETVLTMNDSCNEIKFMEV